MKFVYQYRTPDNVCHGGEIVAKDRDSVFAALKAGGIRPFGVKEAPGLANKVLGLGKRWIAITLLATVALVLAVLFWSKSTELKTLSNQYMVMTAARHQVYGDPAILDEMVITGFASVFDLPGERFLASYAQPGVDIKLYEDVSNEDLEKALLHELGFHAGDVREVREMKAIVNGMKDELRSYLSDGCGTLDLYRMRLKERQENEATFRRRMVAELGEHFTEEELRGKNETLRSMGLKTIPHPLKSDNMNKDTKR